MWNVSSKYMPLFNRQAINHFRRQRPFYSEDADRVVEETPDTEMLAAEQAEQLWAKARRLLGYDPAVGLVEGMARTQAWLRDAGLL